ncbi:uncharacterized protein LOC126902827 isoform X7 [Daktulosphaira vitifoliae]|uniref:uncharacterized protein LOC126902827 isoform X7 n=1 Tax=Daktulosphaira vitifoliae TaxID=58002 RepID=UPI0021AA3F6A|nr:uncharacterized protein LOC126902827 isoform X7 [Daktulosphaira vitifoliae]
MKIFFIILLLSIFILFTETIRNYKKNTDICKSIVKNVGWKDLNDVESIVYWQTNYKLENHLGNITIDNCNRHIRVLTLTLVCSYVFDLKILFFIFLEYGKHCKSFISKKDSETGYQCAIKLLQILQKMPSLATLMKDTLLVLDYLHTDPWKNYFIFENLLLNLEQFNKSSKDFIPTKNDSTTTENFIKFVNGFFFIRNIETHYECLSHCRFVSFDTDLIWKELNEEYQGKIKEDINLTFYDYLSEKVNLKINSIIINKFHRLGFRHDRKTLQIGIPLPSQYKTNDIELFRRPNCTPVTIQREPQNREMEYRWILQLIDSFDEELVNESNTNGKVQLIDFLRQELVNESNTNEEEQLIDFLRQELVNESNTNEEVQLIDFLGQELVNESNTNEEVQLIHSLEQELVNESNTNEEVQLIDSLGQELVDESNSNGEVQLIDFLGQELVNESNTNEEVQLIDFLGKELVNESNTNEEEQLIDILRQELVNESNTNEEVQLIDSLGQELLNESNTNEGVQLTDFLGKELVNESNTNEEVQLIDFLGKELVNESNTNEGVQLIDFLGKELVNESNTNEEVQLTDLLGQELVNESNTNEEVQLIDSLGQELVNESNTNEEGQLIDFHGKELVNESNTNDEVQLIDFLGQGLNPNDSFKDTPEPMEIDEDRENYIKFI